MAFTCDQKEYMSVSLSNLKFDEKVADMVKAQGAEFPVHLLNNIYVVDTFKLNQTRLDRIIHGYTSGLPPIVVKKELGGDKYILLNGRHRVCATLLIGGSTIPCIEAQ